MGLDGRIALVSGAARCIGRAIALASDGADVGLIDIDAGAEETAAAVRGLGAVPSDAPGKPFASTSSCLTQTTVANPMPRPFTRCCSDCFDFLLFRLMMRPPQHGQVGLPGSMAAPAGSALAFETASNSRARAMLSARVPLANRP